MPPPNMPLAGAWEDDWESMADVRVPLSPPQMRALTASRKKTRSPSKSSRPPNFPRHSAKPSTQS
jgi:hypothetical protein